MRAEQKQSNIRTKPSPRSPRANPSAFWRSSRTFYFLFSIFVFAVLTFLARRQAPRPDPFQPVQTLSWDWWQYPLERNAFKRLPVITSNLNDVFALPNSEKVWAVGSGGMIVHSEDGGETWVQQKVNWEAVADSQFTQNLPAEEQQSIDSTDAFDARQQNALRSNVAQKGVNPAPKQANAPVRTPVTRPAVTPQAPPSLQSIHFVDEKHGWAVGTDGTILSTNNGGATWQAQRSGTTSRLFSVHFVNATTGWAVGLSGTILSTNNGGVSWQAQRSGTASWLHSVHFVNATTGWAVGSSETILSTNNNGATWQRQRSRATGVLHSVHFVNATTGWAVGLDGTILATSNGGTTWQAQASGTTSWLYSVHFVNATTGWAAGNDGTILHTTDSGANWQTQKSKTSSDLLSVHFASATTGWVVGNDGTILTTRDAGQNWFLQTSGASNWFYSSYFVNNSTGWVVGGNGFIIQTQDAGKTWQTQPSSVESQLQSVCFLNADSGWAVGNSGTILMTTNGGKTWQTKKSGIQFSLRSTHFINAKDGWVVGGWSWNEGMGEQYEWYLATTNDQGKTWRSKYIFKGYGGDLNAVKFVNLTTGWAAGGDGTILNSNNGGLTWQTQPTPTQEKLFSLEFINSTLGWAVGKNGTILNTSDGGQNWKLQNSETTSSFYSVHFIGPTTGWTAGENGTILMTKDGGQSWRAQKSGSSAEFHSIYFVDDNYGWVVGTNAILATNDGGQTWNPIKYSRSFAPWYYLSLFIIAPLLYLAFRKPKPIEAEQKTVADILVSDRPIAAGDPDPLEFNTIARGLSRFLRNENTQPPLTIAITGEWGSGKSSLMNLLKADLERYGFRPVWFNAWHHQKEEHLLAALLENVRSQAIPPWWRLEGLSFRCHLLWLRAKRRRFVAVLLLLLFAFAVGYVAVNPGVRLANIKNHVTNLGKDIPDAVIALLPAKPAPKDSATAEDAPPKNGTDSSNNFSFLPFLLSAIASLVIVYRGLKAFGVNPVSLMASMSSQFKAGDLKAQMSFRYRFAQEFDEVTRALHPRTMLIFIDDLDRCQPKSVLDILEAVNFLVSNGECYVVLGLDLQRVENYVKEGFKDVQEEDFARQYLQKLINIEVPVPQPSALQSRNLIAPKARETEPARSWWVHALRKAPQFLPKLLPPVIVAATLIAGFILGQSFFPDEKKEQSTQTTIASPAKIDSTSTAVAPVDTTRATSRGEAETPERTSGEGRFIPGQQAQPALTWAFVALALMLVLAAWRLSIPSDVIVKDSPEFEEALRIWHPLIIAKHNTPRSLKRFVNRVRYYAMRQSAEQKSESIWQRLARKLGWSEEKQVAATEHTIAESLLVALSAIHHFKSDLLNREHFKQTPEGDVLLLRMVSSLSPEASAAMRTAMDEHRKNFGEWPPNEEDYEKLQKLSAGIRIN